MVYGDGMSRVAHLPGGTKQKRIRSPGRKEMGRRRALRRADPARRLRDVGGEFIHAARPVRCRLPLEDSATEEVS